MKKSTRSMQSPITRARGLGSARHGTSHWWMQRLTALALIPLTLYFLNGFFTYVVFGSYDGAIYWLRSPYAATFVILLLIAGFHHGASGLQVVIEDYVHCECAKLASILIIKFLAAAFAILGILATAKILFGV